jgi:hypothetical protein
MRNGGWSQWRRVVAILMVAGVLSTLGAACTTPSSPGTTQNEEIVGGLAVGVGAILFLDLWSKYICAFPPSPCYHGGWTAFA